MPLARNDVTRFGASGAGGVSGGVTNAGLGEPWQDIGYLDPIKWISYLNDFITVGDYGMVTTNTSWTITVTQAGAGSAAAVLIDGAGGLLEITNDAADDDAVWAQTVGEAFRWSASKRMIFDCRFKVSDATQSDVVFGLQINDTTPLDVTDGIFFIKTDGAATVDFRVEKDNTATEASDFATLTSDTFVRLTFVYGGIPRDVRGTLYYDFQVYVNGALSTTLEVLAATIPDDEDLGISFGVQNGEAVAKILTVDYIAAAVER